ncbi:MAG: hypothetical protein QXN55_00145 [Candidatus Nitrosotenuis sp.]
MAAVIPEKLYGTFKVEERSLDESERILGFISPFGKDAAFKKRQQTQLKWAYQQYLSGTPYYYMVNGKLQISNNQKFVVLEDGSVKFFRLTDKSPAPSADKFTNWKLPFDEIIEIEESLPENITPKVFDNVELEGFCLAKSVRRVYGGGGIVVWRVEDPRGFELEISLSNLARILDCTTISNGVIQDKCVWGREGGSNILLPVTSDIYKESNCHTNAIKTAKAFSLKDIQPGDVVKIVEDEREFIYCGNFKCLEATEVYLTVDEYKIFASGLVENVEKITSQYKNQSVASAYVYKPMHWKNRYILKHNNTLFFCSTPKITEVVKKVMYPFCKEGLAMNINANRLNFDFQGFNPLFLSTKILKSEDVTILMAPMAEDKIKTVASTFVRSYTQVISDEKRSRCRVWGLARHKGNGKLYALNRSWNYDHRTGKVTHALDGYQVFEGLVERGQIVQVGEIDRKYWRTNASFGHNGCFTTQPFRAKIDKNSIDQFEYFDLYFVTSKEKVKITK